MSRDEQIIQAKKLRAIHGLTYREIAERLDIPRSRVVGWLGGNASKKRWRDIYKEPGSSQMKKHIGGRPGSIFIK